MSGLIRVIGGRWRGRKLPVLNCEGLRPTPDRVKETLFNWLMPIIQGVYCLDCFSGSGSLGFEASSRGANYVALLEKNRKTAQQLDKNSLLLQDSRCKIYQVDALTWLAQQAVTQFDVVFIDPPFHQGLVELTIEQLEKNGWLQNVAYIYIETELNSTMMASIPVNWRLHREKRTGQVHSRLFIREKS